MGLPVTDNSDAFDAISEAFDVAFEEPAMIVCTPAVLNQVKNLREEGVDLRYGRMLETSIAEVRHGIFFILEQDNTPTAKEHETTHFSIDRINPNLRAARSLHTQLMKAYPKRRNNKS